MPRDIPVGNGHLLVTFDQNYYLRDFYYPHVGQDNQTAGAVCRFGLWIDGQLSWVGDEGWERSLRYIDGTVISKVLLKRPSAQIEISCNDCVDYHDPVLIRKMVVRNLSNKHRDGILFFHHDFHLYQRDDADTAYFEPKNRSIIHYKGQRNILLNAMTEGVTGIEMFATGTSGHNGAEGTWRDAEDGKLGNNPIAQGSVDSTFGIPFSLTPNGQQTIYTWIVAGTKFSEVMEMDRIIRRERSPHQIITRTGSYWKLWATRHDMFSTRLPPEYEHSAKQSMLILRTQIDHDGAILAANDSDVLLYARDSYSYMWPRDGALVASAMDDAGFSFPTSHFFLFLNRIVEEEGYFLHKYNPDGSLASSWHPWYTEDGGEQLPIQEDETGLVVWALWRHFHKYNEVELLRQIYGSLIVRPAEFMCRYRDEETGLPLPSHDLWEERHGVHTYTVAAVYAGLMAASNFAVSFGAEEQSEKWSSAAKEIKDALIKHCYNTQEKRFARMATRTETGYTLDMTVDSSLCGLFLFGMFDVDDPLMVSTVEAVEEHLTVRTSIGGIARYENDYYHRVTDDPAVPGNPWFICTLWLAQWQLMRAKTLEELEKSKPYIEWARYNALPSGAMPEQIHPFTGEPLSVSPLTWSHAEMVRTIALYVGKLHELESCDNCGATTNHWDSNRRPEMDKGRDVSPVQADQTQALS